MSCCHVGFLHCEEVKLLLVPSDLVSPRSLQGVMGTASPQV